jgi:hypothetical protein
MKWKYFKTNSSFAFVFFFVILIILCDNIFERFLTEENNNIHKQILETTKVMEMKQMELDVFFFLIIN